MTSRTSEPARADDGAPRLRPEFWVHLFCGVLGVGAVFPLAAFVTFEGARMPGGGRWENLLSVAVGLAGFGFGAWLLRDAVRAWRHRHEIWDPPPPPPRVPSLRWWWVQPVGWMALSSLNLIAESGSLARRVLWAAATLLFAVAFLRELWHHLRVPRAERPPA